MSRPKHYHSSCLYRSSMGSARILQSLLVIIGTILAAAIAVEDAALWRLAKTNSHIERLDCQNLLHPVADRPAHDTARVQVKDDGQIEPSLCGPDITDVASPFAVRCIRDKVAAQNISNNTQAMIAACRDLVFTRANRLDPIDPHQPANTALANIKASFLELHCHAGPAITAKAQPILLTDVRQHLHVTALPVAHRPCQPFAKAARCHLHYPTQQPHWSTQSEPLPA